MPPNLSGARFPKEGLEARPSTGRRQGSVRRKSGGQNSVVVPAEGDHLFPRGNAKNIAHGLCGIFPVEATGEERAPVRGDGDADHILLLPRQDFYESARTAVPQAHRAVVAPGQQVAAIGGEGHGPYKIGMARQYGHRPSRGQFPKTGRAVLGGGGGEPPVPGDGHRGDVAPVTFQHRQGPARSRLPEADGVVAAAGDQGFSAG